MTEFKGSSLSDMGAYKITATFNGSSVEAVACFRRDADESAVLSGIRDAISGPAREAFGDAEYSVSFVKGTEIKLLP